MNRSLNFSSKNKKLLIFLAALGFSGYGVYKVYNLPCVVTKRQRLVKLVGALINVLQLVSDSAETFGVVSRDLREFLDSGSDRIPNSLKQLSKIARSDEFSRSLSSVSEAVALGVLRGYQTENGNVNVEEGGGGVRGFRFVDGVLEKLSSKAGTGFVSVVVGSFAKNLVLAIQSSNVGGEGLNGCIGLDSSKWVDLLCDGKRKVVVADCIQTFVSAAVAVYLDKTKNVNVYDDMFSVLTNSKYEMQVRDVLMSVCNGAVETLVKTSHQVLTSPNSESGQNSTSCGVVQHSGPSSISGDDFVGEARNSRKQKKISFFDIKNNSWVTNVSSTLAVTSNRKFVLDLTGRVTFETVRSLVEFFLRKLMDGLRRSYNVLQEEVLSRGLQVIQYVGGKSSIIVTMCLALYLHILNGTRAFLPA